MLGMPWKIKNESGLIWQAVASAHRRHRRRITCAQ
jgi:hypothetical protein